MARDWTLCIGAPSYRLQLDARHAQMLCQLGTCVGGELAPGVDFRIGSIGYCHTTLLPPGRARVLDAAMGWRSVGGRPAEALLSVDSDTYCDVETLWRALKIAQGLRRSTWAVMGLLVAQDDGRPNAWKDKGERIALPPLWEPVEVWGIGAAITIYNLDWYRGVAPRSGPAWPWTSYGCVPSGVPGSFIGEDVFHAQAVRELGGKVLALYTGPKSTFHAAFRGQ